MTTATPGTERPKAKRNGTAKPPEAAPGEEGPSKRKRKKEEVCGDYLVKRKDDGHYIIQLVEAAIPEEKRSPARHDLTCEDCEKVKRRMRIETREKEAKAAKREMKRRLRALGLRAKQFR